MIGYEMKQKPLNDAQKEELYRLYHSERLTCAQLSMKFGKSLAMIRWYIRTENKPRGKKT